MLSAGAAVRVRDEWPELLGPCHIRTPHYLRGREGVVVRHLGRFRNPEDLAFARPAELLDLYHVGFRAQGLWPDAGGDEVMVEIYGPWLEAVGAAA